MSPKNSILSGYSIFVKDNENWPLDSPAVCLTIPKSSPKEPSFKVSCSSRSASLASLSSYSFVSLTLLSSSAFSLPSFD